MIKHLGFRITKIIIHLKINCDKIILCTCQKFYNSYNDIVKKAYYTRNYKNKIKIIKD